MSVCLSSETQIEFVKLQKFCKERDIAFKSYSVNVDSKKSGLESAARNARYKIFEEVLQPQDQLLLAHHADDVAETILFRLFRGTGLGGLWVIMTSSGVTVT